MSNLRARMSSGSKRSTVVTGACGEHYVAGFLSGHDLIVAMPRAGIPGCDLLVSTSRSGKAIRLQVKTGTQSSKITREFGRIYLWWTSPKVIERRDTSLWYAYLWLRDWPHGDVLPEVFFVPSSVVVKCLRQCIKDEEWPCFWITEKEAATFRGEMGLKPLLKALR